MMTGLPTGTITFLFTDIQGSTTLWERDPEAMKDALARHNALLHGAINSHGGTVFKIVGDSFQAAFRIPARALSAALSAQRALLAESWETTGPLRVRMGLHVGPAEAQDDDYAVSHTLNRVARVMSAGHGGQILLSLAAAELVREHLPADTQLRELGEFRFKGLSQPERIYQVIAPGLLTDFPPIAIAGALPATPRGVSLPQRMVHGRIVGRQKELAAITKAWDRAASGKGHVLLVSGEAGMGKTRLIGELGQRVLAEGAVILLGECFAEGGAPLSPFAEILRGLLGRPADSRSWATWKSYLGMTGTDLLELVPEYRGFFRGLTSAPTLAPDLQHRRLFESYTILLENLAAESPLFVIVDDLHWADELSLNLILHLTRRLANNPVLIATTGRAAEIGPTLAKTLTALERARLLEEVRLEPLSPETVASLVRELGGLKRDPPADFLEKLYARTVGNPFFIEELLKAMEASGSPESWTVESLDAVGVPRSVQETIGWHLDRLSTTSGEVAGRGAVIGRRFDHDFLATVAGQDEKNLLEALGELQQASILVEQSSSGDVTYEFRHPLIHEVLYNRMMAAERRRWHAIVGAELERRSKFDEESLRSHRESLPHHWWQQLKHNGVPLEIDQLAYHHLQAGDWQKAFRFSLLAGDRNTATFASRAGLRWYDIALKLVSDRRVTPDPEHLTDIYTMKLTAQWLLGDYPAALKDGETALKLARRHGDWQREGATLHSMSHTRLDQGQYEEAIELAKEALAIAEAHEDLPGVAHMLVNLGEAYISGVRGAHEEGLNYLQRARPICEAIGDRLGLAHIFLEEGHLKMLRAAYSEAKVDLDRAISLARELRDLTALTRSLNYLGIVLRDQGQYEESMDALQEALRVAQAGGLEAQAGLALANIGTVNLLLGDYQQALENAQRSVALLEAINANSVLPLALAVLGDVYRELGDTEHALESFDRALPIAREVQDPCWESFALAGRGLTTLAGVNPEAALQDLRTAFAVCQRSRDIYSRATIESLIGLASGHLSADQPEEAIRFASEAAEMAEAADICDLSAEGRWILGSAYAQTETWEEAENQLREAGRVASNQDLATIEWRIHHALGEIYRKQGKGELARKENTRAAMIVEKLSQQVPGEKVRKSFLDRPEVQRTLRGGPAATPEANA